MLSASGEISRMVPVTAMSGRPWSDTLTGMPSFARANVVAGDGEDRLARVIAGNLDDHLARDHDLTRVGAGRGDDAVVGRNELGVAELVLGDAEIGFGRLDGRLGALQRLQRVIILGMCGEALAEQDAEALFLGRRLGERGLGGIEIGLGGGHLVLVVDGAELGELLALLDDGADVDIARDEPAADLEADLADIARLDAAGALRHQGELVRRHDDDPRRPRRGWCGGFFFGTAGKTQAGNAGTEERTG